MEQNNGEQQYSIYNSLSSSIWFTIWIKPRNTVKRVLENKPGILITILAILSGIYNAASLDNIKSGAEGLPYFVLILLILLLGAFGGIIKLYLSAALYKFTGKWIGGVSSFEEIKIAVAVSYIPMIWGLLLWIPRIFLLISEVGNKSSIIRNNLYLGLDILDYILIAWSILVLIVCLSEAQKISILKAIANILITLAIVLIPLFFVILGILALSA